MTAVLIKILTALFVLLAVLAVLILILCVLCMIGAGLWTLRHWPKGGWEDAHD